MEAIRKKISGLLENILIISEYYFLASTRFGENGVATWDLQPDELKTTGVHAALFPSGRVLYYSYDPSAENDADRCLWQLWNERTGPVGSRAKVLRRNPFCSGHCWLGDGRLLVAGGQSSAGGADRDLHTFDWESESWVRHADMPAARYYPSCVTLADGDALIVGGAWSRIPSNAVNHEAERFHWRTNTVSPPMPFNPGFIEELYPFLQLLPDGSPQGLLWVHSGKRARLFSPGTGEWLPSTFEATGGGNRNYPTQGSFALLPLLPEEDYRVRVLLVGGGSTTELATNQAQIFEFDAARVRRSRYREPAGGRQGFRRFMSDATLLADGTVLVSSGAESGVADHSEGAVLTSEIFDPATEDFGPSANINRPRMYHVSALLLPSGRVALSGHTEHWNPDRPNEDKSVEIYTPDYLLRGPRPRFTSAPSRTGHGQLLDLGSPDAARIGRVALVRATSVTHSNNMDQRWVGLNIESRGAGGLQVRMPVDRGTAPPGPYMLFLLDEDGVPSVARFVMLDPDFQGRGRLLVVDKWITVPESSSRVDTRIHLEPGDQFALEAEGEIWAGVWLTGRNGPGGWNNVDHDPKFPLHIGGNARPYALIGRFGDGDWFYVGERLGPQVYTESGRRLLYLRTNDDSPGNGTGHFSCHVRVWRDEPLMRIVDALVDRPGDDIAYGGGEFVTLENAGTAEVDLRGWWLADDTGRRLVIRRKRLVKSGARVNFHTGLGKSTDLDYFFLRRSAVWDSDSAAIHLYAPDGRIMASLTV